MATRDLTPLFMECRKRRGAFQQVDHGTDARLLEDDQAPGAWRITLPPQWVDTLDQLEDDMRQLDLRMEELNVLHTKRLMVTFDGSEEQKEREIEAMSQRITKSFKQLEKLLMMIANANTADSADGLVRKNIQKSLAKRLQERSIRFRNTQKEYMKKLAKQKHVSTGGAELDFLTQPSTPSSRAITVGFNQQQLQEVDNMESLVNERDEEITRIAQSIEELSQIFKELAVLVIDQGTVLDRIDFNMEQVVEHTNEGLAQLDKAEEYQKSARPIKCIIFLVIMIFVMLTALILKHHKG